MKTVNVKKEDLLNALKVNKENHEKEYLEAKKEFRAAGTKALKVVLEKFEAGVSNKLHVHLPKPISHVKDYDDAIKMIEFSCDNIIELDQPDAKKLLLDDWGWRGELDEMKTMYATHL